MDNEYVYDPFRCDPCMAYLRESFQGATVLDHIKSAAAEWETHLKKLRRSLEGLEGDHRLKFYKGIEDLRRKCRAKTLDVEYFKELVIDRLEEQEDLESVTPSQTSGLKSPRPGRPESPDKSTKEEVAAL